MDELEFKLLLKYPTIIPVNEERTEYKGYMTVNDTDYDIYIQTPSDDFEGYNLKITTQLQKFKKELNDLIKSADEYDLLKFLDCVKEIIASKTEKLVIRNFSNVYRHVINEFIELREFYFNIEKCILEKDLSQVKILYKDSSNRIHLMIVGVNFDESENLFYVSESSLPDCKNKDLFQPSSSLKVLYKRFFVIVENLQYFFDVMDALDECSWVLDPETPLRKDCYRRIALGSNASVIITIDPWNPMSPPNLKFLGPERIVEEFRQKCVNNLEKWDNMGDTISEILKLLEISNFLPKQQENNKEIILYDGGECCICFSLRLNDKLPEIICSNQSCEQFFHQECLYQWLTSVSARKSLNEIHGQCPNCEKHISCPIN